MRRRWLVAVVGVAALLGGSAYWVLRPPPRLTVVSWGEDYSRAQMLSMFHPFADKTGVDVDSTIYGGGLKEVRNQVTSGHVDWDVVDFELADAMKACRDGLLEPITAHEAKLPPGIDGKRAGNDFVPGALGPCWVGSVVYSQMIVYDPKRFSQTPTTVADFFDLKNFPGKRALRDSGPKYNLELALLADGVKPENVYPMLRTKEGADRAFAKLDSIKPDIVWWRDLDTPIEQIASGQVAMADVLNGRFFDAVTTGTDIAPIWDGQLYQLDVFGILKGSRHKRQALSFIRFATAADQLAKEALYLPYGPARRSALRLVGRNPRTGTYMRPFLPTAPQNFHNALAINPQWWDEYGAPLEKRWKAWRAAKD